MKKGLILEGGGMRGMFTAGVLDVFMENGIEFDGAIGVSAGAVFGCNYKSRQIGRAIRYNMKYCRDERYCSIKSWVRTGNIFGAQFCYHYLPTKLDYFDTETFRKNPLEFYVVTTDVKTGNPIYHRINRGTYYDLEWMRASASLPLVSTPVKIGRREMLDGGISDSIPIKYFESIGYNRNVVVLTQPDGYKKKYGASQKATSKAMRIKYPAVAKALKHRAEMYNDTIKYIHEREEANSIFVIRPPEKLQINRIEKNPANLKRVYMIGRKEAKKCLSSLKKYLAYET
jgi:Predicted esterase of the alpha-beta hydrolase superfamily